MSKHDAHIKPHPGDSHSAELGFEVSDANVKGIVFSGIAIVVACVISFIFSIFVAKALKDGEWGKRLSDYDIPPLLEGQEELHNEWVTDIRLQANPEVDLRELEDKAHSELKTIGTVSDSPNIYRIPVEEAIDLVSKHGLPDFELK